MISREIGEKGQRALEAGGVVRQQEPGPATDYGDLGQVHELPCTWPPIGLELCDPTLIFFVVLKKCLFWLFWSEKKGESNRNIDEQETSIAPYLGSSLQPRHVP